MDKFPMMVYYSPGPEQFEGNTFSWHAVGNEEELAAAKSGGWAEGPVEALKLRAAREAEAAKAADSAPPTRAELEQKAKELGLEFTFATTDAELGAAISKKLAG